MSNFWKQKVARESVELDAQEGVIDLPADFDFDTSAVTELHKDGEQLADDMETFASIESREDVLDEEAKEVLELAQESIRRRWGIQRTTVAHESVGDFISSGIEFIKRMFRRFAAWLKELGYKLKDQWLKFSNAGKTAVKRGEAYKKVCDKLGDKKNDTMSGEFITLLMYNGAVATPEQMADVLTSTKKIPDVQYDVVSDTIKTLNNIVSKYDLQSVVNAKRGKENMAKVAAMFNSPVSERAPVPQIGNRSMTFTIEDGKLIADLTESGNEPPSQIDVPDVAKVKRYIDIYIKFGAALEKTLKDFRRTDVSRKSLAKIVDDLSSMSADSLAEKTKQRNGTEEDIEAIKRGLTGIIAETTTVLTVYDRLAATNWNIATRGLDGFIKTSIENYNKK